MTFKNKLKNNKFKIAIIGYGRFGKLLAKILYPFGEILVISRRNLNYKNIKKINYSDLKEADWIIPAVPISELQNVLKKINQYLKEGSLVMDVCSVKVYPCKWLKKHISPRADIMGTHPMFGPDSAKNGLKGLQIVLCPIRISSSKLKIIKDIFKKLELKIIKTTPKEHDKQTAKSLALVHYLGRALAEAGIKKENISTLGFQRLLAVNETVNNDTWQLFLDMHNYNPYAENIRNNFIRSLEKINSKIKSRRFKRL